MIHLVRLANYSRLTFTVSPVVKAASPTLPPYIQPAYVWLLDNLHNPYPPKETKIAFAKETGSSVKDIETWFIDVRKRIGWNKLRSKHYANKRSKIVDAATCFFKQIPQTAQPTRLSGIKPTDNHNSEFKAIESRARELYSDKSFETPLATKLDDSARDLMPEARARAHAGAGQVPKSKRRKAQQRLSAYPSPEHSPERSFEPSATSPLPVPNAAQLTSRKRRNSDRDSPEFDIEDRHDQPQKRSRLDSYRISYDLAVASLPSPAASLPDIPPDGSATPSDQALSKNDCILLPTPPIPTVPSGKRKRRLSDAGNDGPPKRPHNALAVPRLQAVSDPLPLAGPTITELYKTLYVNTISDDIPGPVSVESLDDTQVEVGFYNYHTSPDTFWLSNSSSGPYHAANSEPPSLDKSHGSDPNFDFLLEGYPDVPLFPDILSHDHSSIFSFDNMLPTHPPQEDVLSDHYFQSTGLSWGFQGNDDSFSAAAPFAGTLPSSDHVPPPIIPTQNQKEAKLKQIEALRAQLQNLEAEL
ncbi:hypothetical protein BYT27DRAFT_6590390 [Phlegmacium glaucopus]|nr:hypothetical protein BYT27DRAFT_6590390 [Phlegmacium glaucopus]